MASSFDPFAANADPFATFSPPVPSSPTGASSPVAPYPQQQQQQQQQQQHGAANPFAVYANQAATQPAPVSGPNPTHVVNNSVVPVAPHQQQNQWAVQASPNASVGGFSPNPQMIPNGYPQPHTQQVSPVYSQDQSAMVQSPNPSNGYAYPSSTANSTPQQSSNMHASVTSSPVVPPPAAAPAVTVDDDNDFFGDFSNSSPAKSPEAPNRPPSVFEAAQNDDVSYLSRSTNGGLSERQPTNGKSPLDDPKFAPKPRAPEGLANAIALSQEAPATASPLPDFNMITHSGYTLARISFRTILIKKWKQIFWVSYGDSKVLFFRSNNDFEDWISNPYLSQPQRDFLVKLNIDFVGDIGKQSVRGYQVTNQRLKNYNNRML